MKIIFVLGFAFLLFSSSFSQIKQKPKLVVGIVVDQMRYDYLERFYNDFDDKGGFKRILNNGTNFTNCKINYIPTVTGVGHTAVYTGTTPFYNGIIANDWKDRESLDWINCCRAITSPETSVGEGISKDRSPEQLMSTTIGDQLKLNSFGKSKVISISLKDRGALLPAGKSADGAFWFDGDNGNFISSFYYYDELPNWIKEFNNSDLVNEYVKKEWTLLKSKEVYSHLPGDNSKYEADTFNEGKTSFPHTLKNVAQKDLYWRMTQTPFGNQILVDLAKEAILNEDLGKDDFTDHLAISFSTPDKIGHDYGPQSYEVMDNYLRLDLQLGELFDNLDKQVGIDNYILFLTADHGVMENTQHLLDMNFDAGVLENTNFYDDLVEFLKDKYGSAKIIKTRFSRNLYLDHQEIENLKLEKDDVEEAIKDYLLLNVSEIENAYTRTELEEMSAGRENSNFLLNGFNKKRSGDILYSLKANYLNWEHKHGSQHGSGHEYDNHIPLLFYGANIPAATRNEQVYIVDIAATVADFIGINKPSDSIGIPLLNKY